MTRCICRGPSPGSSAHLAHGASHPADLPDDDLRARRHVVQGHPGQRRPERDVVLPVQQPHCRRGSRVGGVAARGDQGADDLQWDGGRSPPPSSRCCAAVTLSSRRARSTATVTTCCGGTCPAGHRGGPGRRLRPRRVAACGRRVRPGRAVWGNAVQSGPAADGIPKVDRLGWPAICQWRRGTAGDPDHLDAQPGRSRRRYLVAPIAVDVARTPPRPRVPRRRPDPRGRER